MTLKTINGIAVASIKTHNGRSASEVKSVLGETWSHGPTVIGQAYGGGYYAGKIAAGGGGIATHYLIVAPKVGGEAYGKKWGPVGQTLVTGASSVIDGPHNTSILVALGSTYEAAVFCQGLTIGGYTDWYMPAKNELIVLYYFLKPGTTANSTSYGSNAYAVSPEPISTNYTSGSPAQTSAVAFRIGAASQQFVEDHYWCSTELSDGWSGQEGSFLNGSLSWNAKGSTGYYVRAVRRVAI